MRLIEQLNQKYDSVSIIGLAKNAGKTVTLNYLIEQASESGITLGLTSTGRDGEKTDIVTATDKPVIFVSEGTLIATAKSMLELGDAGLEILESTDFTSSLGNIIICRVKEEGCIQLAGPANATSIFAIKQKLIGYGAELVLIDGAIDRKAVSSPVITDACIVSTGAVLSRDIKKVVSETTYFLDILMLPSLNDDKLMNIKNKLNKTCIVDKEYKIIYPEIMTGLGHGKTITTYIDENTKYIYINGAVTTTLLKDLTGNERKITIILEDGTKIFSDSYNWNNLKKKGLKINVLNPINIEAITVNPISPFGYSFKSNELVDGIKKSIKNIEVIDVVNGGE